MKMRDLYESEAFIREGPPDYSHTSDLSDDDADDGKPSFDHLPPIAAIKTLRSQISEVAQKRYDAWEQDADGYDEEVGCGGICHLIADDVCSLLSNAGYNVWTQCATDVQHVTCVVQCRDGIVDVDVPYRVYETGAGFTWKKIPNVVFEPDDVVIYKIDGDPSEIRTYVEHYDGDEFD